MDPKMDRCGWTFLLGEPCFHLWATKVAQVVPKGATSDPKGSKRVPVWIKKGIQFEFLQLPQGTPGPATGDRKIQVGAF